MTIAITAIGVVVPVSELEARWPGGEAGYRAAAPNATCRSDGHLVAIDFMTPGDVAAWVDGELASRGLVYVRDGKAVDVAVVDARRGPCAPCDWLWFEGEGSWGRATRVGSPASAPVWPPGYSADAPPELDYVDNDDVGARMSFRSIDADVACFVDEHTREERFIGAVSPDVLGGILVERLRALHGRVEECRDVADRGEELADDARETLLGAAEEAERIRTAVPALAAEASYVAGLARRVAGQFERALEHWRSFTELRPDHPGGFMELTWCSSELGRHQDAVAAAERAVALVPDHAGAVANMGLVLMNLGRLDEAGAWIERAIALNPDDPVTLHLQATFREQLARK